MMPVSEIEMPHVFLAGSLVFNGQKDGYAFGAVLVPFKPGSFRVDYYVDEQDCGSEYPLSFRVAICRAVSFSKDGPGRNDNCYELGNRDRPAAPPAPIG